MELSTRVRTTIEEFKLDRESHGIAERDVVLKVFVDILLVKENEK